MIIWLKRGYLIFVIILFLIASFIVMSLALGYKYNFSKSKFEKTSVLYVKSYPDKATIILNNDALEKKTPNRITYLNPDLYNIKLNLEGYQDWEKQLLIKPNQSVFIEDVSLFYEEAKSEIIKNGNFKALSLSPDQNKLLFYDKENNNLYFYDKIDSNIYEIEKEIKSIDEAIWSNDNKKIILKTDNLDKTDYFISFSFSNLPIVDLKDYFNFVIKKCVWDKFDSNLLYVMDYNNSVYRFDVDKKEIQKVNLENIVAFKPEKSKIFYISNKNKIAELYEFDLNKNIKKKLITLNKGDNYEFLSSYNDYIALLNKKNNTLYLIDPNDDDYLIKKFYGINDIKWDLYNRTLLLCGDFEIWSYDILTKEEKLINRFSTKITNSFWHRNNNHIFYKIENKFYVIEMDNRDKKNIFSLGDISSKIFLTNKKGNVLYHITSYGLIKTQIQ